MNASPVDLPLHTLTPEQRQRRIAWVAIILGAVFLAGCFWPSLAGWDMMHRGFGTITIFVFLIIVCAVTAGVYWWRANQVRRLFHGDGLLATWTYPKETWRKFVAEDFVAEATDKRHLLYIVTFFIFLIGGGFWLFDREAGGIVFVALLALLAVIAFVAIIVPRIRYRHQLTHQEPVYIGKYGVWIGGFYHDWTMLDALIESCSVQMEADVPYLSITYSFTTRGGRDETTVRIPIPQGKEDEAARIAETIKRSQSGIST